MCIQNHTVYVANSDVVFVYFMVKSLKINVLVLKQLQRIVFNRVKCLSFHFVYENVFIEIEQGLALLEICWCSDFLGRILEREVGLK